MNEYTQAEVEYEITHDFVLDVYEQSLYVDDPVKKAAIVAAAEELSKSIGDFLVRPEQETDE